MYRQEDPEVNLEQVLERIRAFFGRLKVGGGGGGQSVIVVFAILLVALVGWLATGFYIVQPGELGALRMLGKYNGQPTDPGLHWFWPAPIGTKAIVNVAEVRRLEVGLRGSTPVLAESLMITGDENLVDAQLLVQYDIGDIEKFLFRAADPETVLLKSATESSLRQVVGQRDIDDVLTVLKEEVQAETKLLLQGLLDDYETGINVREVKLQQVQAPAQVQDAFDDVVRAQEDKERVINLAQAYAADILPRARGEASRTIEIAEAFKAERVAIATGEASRFLQIYDEFKLAEDVTRQRLYLEAVEEILGNVNKYIVSGDTGGNLLQFLPLTESDEFTGISGP